MELFVLLVPAFTLHQVFEKCLLTSGSLFMSQWFFLRAPPPPCVFFLHQPNFSLHMRRSQRQFDWHAVRQAMPFQRWSISPFLRACICVCVCLCVCVEKWGYCQDVTGTLCMFFFETGAPGWALVHDSCLSSLSSLHLTPDQHPLPHSFLFLLILFSSSPPTLFPPRLTSSHGTSLGRPEWWTPKAGGRVALSMWWCGAAGLSQA